METLYRKVAVSERKPNDSGYYFGIDSLGHREYPYFDNDENKWESIWETVYWLEEIPYPTAQLKADKEELLSALEDCKERIEKMNKKLLRLTNYYHVSVYYVSGLISLIQKHKQ